MSLDLVTKICVSVQKTNRIVRSGIAYIGFSRNRRRMNVFITFQFQMNKKEITKFDVDFKKFFCWRSNLSRMLTNNFLEVRSANGCEKCHFWSETGPRIPGFISNCQNFLAEPSRETRSFSGLSACAVRANPIRIRKKLRCP